MNPPDTPTNPPPSRPIGLFACAVGLVLWGLFPYRVILGHFPWKVDAIKWATQGATTNPDLLEWLFGSTHFVGYRPITAVTFWLNNLTTGWHPQGYRLTDFALHGTTALVLCAIARRLFARTGPWALVPMLVFLAHPAVEETLPYLARRSYLLSVLFGVVALWCHLVNADRPARSTAWTMATATAVALSLLSNEVAYVLLPTLPLFAWYVHGDVRRALQTSAMAVIAAPLAVVARFGVLGWSGGYVRHYFVYTMNGDKKLANAVDADVPAILASAWDYVFFPVSFAGSSPFTSLLPFAFLIASFYFFAVVVEPFMHRHDRKRVLPALLGTWIFGYALLYGLSRTWFWRQGYPMVAPFALLVGVVLWDTVVRFRDRPAVLVMRLIPQGLLIAGVLQFSPMFIGMSVDFLRPRMAGQQTIHEVTAQLESVESGQVYTILPVPKTALRSTNIWIARLAAERGVQVDNLAHGSRRPQLVRLQEEVLIISAHAAMTRAAKDLGVEKRRLNLGLFGKKGEPTYVIAPDRDDGWLLVRGR